MSYASDTFITSGVNEQNFTITWTAPYYMDTSHVSATVNGDAWVVDNVNGTTITLASGIPASATVVISRTTDISDNEVNFLPGAAFRAQDVNADFDQLLFAIQENRDGVDELDNKVDNLEESIDQAIDWVTVTNTLALNNVDTTDFVGGEGYQVMDSTNMDGTVALPDINNPPPNPAVNGLPPAAMWDDQLITRLRWNGSSWDFRVYVAVDPDGRYLNDGEVDLSITTTNTTNVINNTGGDNATLVGASSTDAGLMVAADKTKLDGVAAGAEVNVQSDWDETDTSSDAFILNKPTIPTDTNTTYTLPIGFSDPTATITLTGSDSSTDTVRLTAGSNIDFSLSGDNLTIDAVIPADNNTTYDLLGAGTADIRLTGSDGSTDDITLQGSGATSVTRSGNTFTFSSTDTDTNTTYGLAGSGTSSFRLTGSDGTTNTINLSGSGGTTLSRSGNTITINSAQNDSNTTYDFSAIGSDDPSLRLSGSDGSNDDVKLSGSGSVTVSRSGSTVSISGNRDFINRTGTTSETNRSYRVMLGTNNNNTGNSRCYVVTDATRLYYNPSTNTLTLGNGGTVNANLFNGNAVTATTLETSRTLWGRSFNGSANVSGNITSANNVTGADSNMTIQPLDSGTNRTLILRGNSTSGSGGGVTIGNSARGTINLFSGTSATGYRFHKSGQGSIHGRLNFDNLTGTRAFAFPDENGTLALDKNTVNLTGNQTIAGNKTFNNTATFQYNSTDSIKVNKTTTTRYAGITFSEVGDARYLIYLNNNADATLNLQARKNGTNFKSVLNINLDGDIKLLGSVESTKLTRCQSPSNFWKESASIYYVDGIGGVGTAGSNRLSLFCGGYRNSSGTWTADREAGEGAAKIDLDPRGFIYFDVATTKTSGSSTTIPTRFTLDASNATFYATLRSNAHNIVQEGSGYYTNSGTTTGYGYVDRKTGKSGTSHIGYDSGCYGIAGMNDINCFQAKPLWSNLTSGGTVRKVYGFRVNSSCAPTGSAYNKVAASAGVFIALSNQSGRRIRQIECTGNAASDIPGVSLRALSFKTPDYFNALALEEDDNGVAVARTAEQLHVQDTAESVGTGIYMNAEGNLCFARNGQCTMELGNGQVIGNLVSLINELKSRISALETGQPYSPPPSEPIDLF